LKELLLCDCGFSGEIPPHFSNLTQLQVLLLYSNNLVGTIELTFFSKFPDLIALDLSYNNLVVLDGEYNSTITSFITIFSLALAGCRMSKFPNFLRHQHELNRLSLANNEIPGAIPQWAWATWNDMSLLFLGNNKFTSVGHAPFLPIQLEVLDLSNNMFEGTIPIPQGSAGVLDYSNNRFSSVPYNFSYHLTDVSLFDASGNNLSGNIPSSFCARTSIQLLDLSNNNFSGPIPSCLMENVNGMQSLNLKENQLYGEFPDCIKEGCSLEALDFSGNWIEGKLPRSLAACKDLEILDVANNQISDSFPCWMSALHRLEVLVLKSNKFFGQVAQLLHEEENACAFPSAIIVDLSSNNFSGPLPRDQWFKMLKSIPLFG
jgi:Leucine-rich repeat (LRR) protein